MIKVSLGSVLKEERNKIGQADGNGLNLIGVSNEYGLHISRAARIENLSRYQIIKKDWFAYNPMRVNVGSIGIALKPEDEGIVSPDYVVFSCTEKILPDYLLFFLKSDIGLEAIEKNASGAVRKRLYFSDLARIELNVPSISEQAKMLGSIQKIETIVTQLKDPIRLDRISQLKQAILQEAIQGKLTAEWRVQRQAEGIETEPASELLKRIQIEKVRLIKEKRIKKEKPLPPISEEEKPFELPVGWEWCRMLEIGLFERGKSKHRPRNDLRLFENGSTPFVQTGEVSRSKSNGYLIDKNDSFYNDFGLKQSRLWPKGTMCITIAANIAQTGFLGIGACFPDSVVGFTPLSGNSISKFVRYFIDLTKTDIEKYAPATAQKNINLGIINELKIPLPPEEELKIIVERVDSLMAKCRELEIEINQSEQYAQQLMQAVLKEGFESS